MNLIAPKEMLDDEIDEFHSNLREMMLYIKYSKDREKVNQIIEENLKFQSMERQAAEEIYVVMVLPYSLNSFMPQQLQHYVLPF